MTAVLLATWPERFAAGAIIGGLPYGTAIGVRAALERMRGAAATATLAIAPAPRMPRIAIWHGTADPTVVIGNSDALVDQWCRVHALPAEPHEDHGGTNWSHRAWCDAQGHALVEEWRIAGMGHGVPVDPLSGIGATGPFMLDVGLSSTLEIARGWGLVAPAIDADAPPPARPAATSPTPAEAPTGVRATIEQALRSAGLMR